jgi:Na+/H+-dicarboxylate symporter
MGEVSGSPTARPGFPGRLGLSSRILIGLVLGVLLGLFAGEPAGALQPVADVYIRLMQMTVLPYLVLTLIVGLGGLDAGSAKRLATRAGLTLIVLSVAALAVIGAMPLAFPPFENASFFSHSMLEPAQPLALSELYVPANPFNALANAVVPAVVLFSTAIGIALIGVPGKKGLLDNLRTIEQAVVRVTRFVIGLTPIGVFAIAAVAAGTMEPATLQRLEVYLVTFGVAALLLTFVVLPLAVTAVTPFRYTEVIGVARDALLTAFVANSAFIVLPILVERANSLMARHGLRTRDTDAAVEVVAPVAFTFPNAGKLLTLLFVPYVAWLTGDPLGPGGYGTLFGVGVISYFAKSQVALPFLMDLVGVPHDYFQLYIPTAIVTGKLDALTSAMCLLAMALISAVATTGALRLRTTQLLATIATIVAAVAVAVVGARLLLAATVDTSYRQMEVVRNMHLPRGPLPATQRADLPPPEPMGGSVLERIRARNVLRVGYVPDRLPFTFVNARGELVGMDVELAGRLAQDLGVASVEYFALRWDTLGDVVAERRVDKVMSVPYVTELLRRARYSMPYFDGHLGFVVRDERRHDFATLEQIRRLRRVTLGVMVEIPTLEALLREFLAGVDVRFTIVDTSQGMPGELPASVDALVMLAESGAAWSLVHPQYSVVVPQPNPLRWPTGVVTRKGSADLGDFVDDWLVVQKASGTVGRAYDYWVLGKGTEVSRRRWTVLRDVLGWGD